MWNVPFELPYVSSVFLAFDWLVESPVKQNQEVKLSLWSWSAVKQKSKCRWRKSISILLFLSLRLLKPPHTEPSRYSFILWWLSVPLIFKRCIFIYLCMYVCMYVCMYAYLLEQPGQFLYCCCTLYIWVWHQKMNMSQEISLSASIYKYLHLDLLKYLDSTLCLNPPISQVSKTNLVLQPYPL